MKCVRQWMFSALFGRFWNVWQRCCWEYWKYFMPHKRMGVYTHIVLYLPVAGEHFRFAGIYALGFLCANTFLTPGILMLWDIWMNCCRSFCMFVGHVYFLLYKYISLFHTTEQSELKTMPITNSSRFVQICAKAQFIVISIVRYHFNWAMFVKHTMMLSFLR